MRHHSKLSASKAARWTACPGSIPLTEYLLEKEIIFKQDGNDASREGTALHAVMEHCLIHKINAIDVEKLTYDDHGQTCTIEPDDEQIEAVQFVLDKARSLGTDIMTETRVNYGHKLKTIVAEAFGTVDIAVVNKADLHIVDAKFGRHYVDEFQNKQMLLYAIGMVNSLEALGEEIKTVTMHIAQPRCNNAERSGWTISREELDDWIDYFATKAKEVYQAQDELSVTKAGIAKDWTQKSLSPSNDACRWCEATPACPARQQMFNEEFDVLPETIERIELLTPERLADVLDKAELVTKFIEAVKAQAFHRLLNGMPVDGYHLILGRQGNRQWIDPEGVELDLKKKEIELDRDELFEAPKMKTPAKLEKSLSKLVGSAKEASAIIDELTERAEPKPTLAPLSKSGKPWVAPDVKDDFDPVKL